MGGCGRASSALQRDMHRETMGAQICTSHHDGALPCQLAHTPHLWDSHRHGPQLLVSLVIFQRYLDPLPPVCTPPNTEMPL